MKNYQIIICMAVSLLFSSQISATGLATCESGPQESWKTTQELEDKLTEKGWTVRRIKIDGGCYEVYAVDENDKRVEAYFHPETLEPVPLDQDKAGKAKSS
jgi:hypothetical protein